MNAFTSLAAKFGIVTDPARRPTRVIDITDPGKDVDDEQKFILIASFISAGFIELAAVVANLAPADLRARLAKGTFNALGHRGVRVGVGSAVSTGGVNPKAETDAPYLAGPDEVEADGHALLVAVLEGADNGSIVLMLNSGMTDAARLLREEPELCRQKLAGVTIMGGVETEQKSPNAFVLKDGLLVPNDAANNTFDFTSAAFTYRTLQELRIPMTIITRLAVYEAQFPVSLFRRFAATGNPVGACLKARHGAFLQQLWRAALAPQGSPVRDTLPMNRDRAWFVNNLCGGNDPGIGADGEIAPFVLGSNQYDPAAVVAAIPELRDRFYEPVTVETNGVAHRVIGVSKERHGIKDKDGLMAFMSEMEIAALLASA